MTASGLLPSKKLPISSGYQWIRYGHGGGSGRAIISKEETAYWTPHWPQLEEALYAAFIARRKLKRGVSVHWFRAESKKLFTELFPDSTHLFLFSNGWFNGFLRRYRISYRRITKKATKLPEDVLKEVSSFLRFIKRVSQPKETNNLVTSPRRFKLGNILNLDETPIPFEFTSGSTYAETNSQSVEAKQERSGWDKRQATLILYPFADGSHSQLKPKLIFHGKPDGFIMAREGHLYAP